MGLLTFILSAVWTSFRVCRSSQQQIISSAEFLGLWYRSSSNSLWWDNSRVGVGKGEDTHLSLILFSLFTKHLPDYWLTYLFSYHLKLIGPERSTYCVSPSAFRKSLQAQKTMGESFITEFPVFLHCIVTEAHALHNSYQCFLWLQLFG